MHKTEIGVGCYEDDKKKVHENNRKLKLKI